jgi:co-chaperonin GroES (HSP10)
MQLEQEDISSPYTLLRDFYLVQVDDVWETSKTKSGIITKNNAYHAHDNAVDELEDRGEHKRRYGKVIDIPLDLSDDVMVELIDPGTPQSRRYIGHEWLNKMNRMQARGYRDHEDPRQKYYPGTFENYGIVSVRDVAKRNTVKIGDKVYFEHTCTDMEYYLGKHGDGHLFAMRADKILCVVKLRPIFLNHEHHAQKQIIPQGDWVFVELSMEGWDDITVEIAGKPVLMKVSPEALPLQGKVVAGPKDLEGKTVVFEREADAPIEIEGANLTCMRLSDILATIKTK